MEQPLRPQFPYCPVPGKAAYINTKGEKNPCIFYAVFQNNCLASREGSHSSFRNTALFFLGICAHEPSWQMQIL